jgi:hypothetical protein
LLRSWDSALRASWGGRRPAAVAEATPNGGALTSAAQPSDSDEREAASPTSERSERVRYTGAVSLDTALRRHVYSITLDTGTPPTIADLSALTSRPDAHVRDALRQLAVARIFVLQPASGEILMAPPFSAIPTPFLVRTPRHESYANCAWDAIGVPVMLGARALIVSACGCCGESITVEADPSTAPASGAVVHFAVPARQWWDDLVFT